MVTEDDIARVTEACRVLPEPAGDYLFDDFLVNLVATVVDFQTHTTAVERAITHFRDRVCPGPGGVGDLVELMGRWPPSPEGNAALAQHLWGYKMWTRAQMLRDLAAYFASVGVAAPITVQWKEPGCESARESPRGDVIVAARIPMVQCRCSTQEDG